MAEEPDKPADAAQPKKGKLGLIIGIVIAAVTLIGGSVAGAVLGPRLLGSEAAAHEGAADGEPNAEDEETEGPEKISAVDVPPVVVDLRDADGRLRHLKVGLTAELGDKVMPEEFKVYLPRAREAMLTYLRSLSFEDVSDPQHFLIVKDELTKRVTEAVGAKRVHRMMLTDFVLQ